jgi:hypothetical protein
MEEVCSNVIREKDIMSTSTHIMYLADRTQP